MRCQNTLANTDIESENSVPVVTSLDSKYLPLLL